MDQPEERRKDFCSDHRWIDERLKVLEDNNERLNSRVDKVFYMAITTLLSVIATLIGVGALFIRG